MKTQNDYQWLFRKSPTMATSIAEDGVYLDVNDTMLSRLGYKREEMVGRSPEDFTTQESAIRIRDELKPALRRTGKLENKPISFLTKSGEIVDCISNAIVELDQKGMQMPQRFGSASSYGKKYALGNLFLIDDTQDSDATNDHGQASVNAKQWLNRGTAQYHNAIDYVKAGGKVDAIKKKYSMTKEIEAELSKV